MSIASIFAPDHARYDGVRPIHVWALRMFYLLMFVGVGVEVWGSILAHRGPWDPTRAVAMSVWAVYPTLGLLGLVHPLRMLPIMLFMIGYKLLWLAIVALPLWRAGALDGSPAEAMAKVFIWVPIVMLAVPWGYVVRTYALPARRPRAASAASAEVRELDAAQVVR